MVVERFEPCDVFQMRVQKAQLGEFVLQRPSALEMLARYPSFTARVNGEVIACAGMVENALGCGGMWALLSEDAARHMLSLTRAGRRMLNLYRYRRVETSVAVSFPQGCRWLEILGFEREGTMRAFAPDGDHYRYARVP